MDKLALFGGEKTINLPAPHYKWPAITKKTEEAVLKQLHTSISIYDNSGIIDEFEKKFASKIGMKHALLTNSGTMALFSLFFSAGLKEGDEIICPAYTFHATDSPIFFTGAVPVLADCKEDGNIDPQEIKKKITKKTKAIIITHMWGIPCDMDEIVKIAKENKLLLFEDCSHAHFARYKGKYVGTFGDASVFSLQGQKTLTGGEGGVYVTNNDEMFYKSLLLGHYNKRCKKEIPENNPLHKYFLTGMGLKLRVHPLAVAIALEQMDALSEILKNRAIIAEKLRKEFKDIKGIKLLNIENKGPTWYAFTFLYNPEELEGLSLEKFYSALVAEGCVELDHPGSTMPLNLTPLFQDPSKLFPSYKNKMNYHVGDMPNAERFYKLALKLPVWHNLEDIKLVELYIKAFKKVTANYKQLLNINIENMEVKQRDNFFKELIDNAKKEGIQKVVVAGVIKEGNKILLLERKKEDFMGGINELPSGNLEQGELLEEGLIREIKEETNLDVAKIKEYLGSFDYVSGSGKKVRQFNFLVSVKLGEVKLTEHSHFYWAERKDSTFDRVTAEVKGVLEKV